MDISIFKDRISSNIHDKRDDFYFNNINFSFLGGVVAHPHEVYISQLLKESEETVTSKLNKHDIRFLKLSKALSTF